MNAFLVEIINRNVILNAIGINSYLLVAAQRVQYFKETRRHKFDVHGTVHR